MGKLGEIGELGEFSELVYMLRFVKRVMDLRGKMGILND